MTMKLRHVLFFFALGFLMAGMVTYNAQGQLGSGSGTINQLTQWLVSGGHIKIASSTASLWVPGLASSNDCVVTDAEGKMSTATCGTGSGSSASPWLYSDSGIYSTTTAEAPSFTATSTTDASTLMGRVGIGTTSPTAKLQVEALYRMALLAKRTDKFNFVQYKRNAGAWTDITAGATESYGTVSGDVLDVIGDTFTIGKTETFTGAYIDIGTAKSATGVLVWEYSLGSDTWGTLTVTDGTNSLVNDGAVTFTPPVDWATDSQNSSASMYFIRVRAESGTFTAEPTVYLVAPGDGTNMLEVYANAGDTAPSLLVDNTGGVAIGYTDSLTYRLRVAGAGYFGGALTAVGVAVGGALSGATTGAFSGAITNTLTATGGLYSGGFIGVAPASTALIRANNSPIVRLGSSAWDGTATDVNSMEILTIPQTFGSSVTSASMVIKNSTISGVNNQNQLLALNSAGNLSITGSSTGSEMLQDYTMDTAPTTNWTVTGDWAYSTNDFTFTRSSGAGTITQSSSRFLTPAVANRWYKVTYVVGVLGPAGTEAWIGQEFADRLYRMHVLTTGTYDIYVKASSTPSNFVIYTTANTTSGLRLDSISVKEVTSGDIMASGQFTGGGVNGIKVDSLGYVGIGTTTPSARFSVAGDTWLTGALRVNTLNALDCDVKATTDGVFYCGTDATGGGGGDFATSTADYWLSTKTTSNVSEGSNLYYTDARVNAYIHGSSTIPKTYTANTFTGLQTIGNASTTHLSVSGTSYLGTVKTGTWNGTSLTDAYVDDTITASNYLSLSAWYATTSKPNLATVGTITAGVWNGTAVGIAYGGTNATSFGNHMLVAYDGTRLVSTSTPTVARIVATSTATSTLPHLTGSFFSGYGLSSCVGTSNKVTWADGTFRCETDQTGGGGGGAINWLHNGTYLWSSSTIQVPALYASTTATSTIANLGGVFDASAFSGADIGAKINSAYSALPANGGTIYVPRGDYSFSTPINISTHGKPALIKCEAGGSTRLTYTGSTGTSTIFNVDWSSDPTSQEWGMGIDGCWFYGEDNGYSNTGLSVGGANGGQGFILTNTRWYTFGTGLWLDDNVYVAKFSDNLWNWNGTNVKFKDAPDNSGESIWFENNLFESYDTFGADCVDTGSYWTSVQFTNNSFDDCGVRVGAYSLSMRFTGNHFESPSGDDTEAYTFITIDASTGGESNVFVTNNVFYSSKNTTRPSAYIDNNGATAVIENNAVLANTYPIDNFVDCEPSGAYCELRNNSLSANAVTTVIDDLHAQSTAQYFGFDYMQVKDGGSAFGWNQDTSNNFAFWWGNTQVATSTSIGNWQFAGSITSATTTATSTLPRLHVTTAFNLLGDYITNVSTWFTTRLQAVTSAVLTGTWDFGGATFLEIPNGTSPTANDPGEIAHDTTGDQLIVDDYVMGSAVQKIWGTTIASTSPAFISGGLLPVPTYIDGYTITRIQCHVTGGTSKVIAVEDASANSSEDITCGTTNTTDDGSITNATYTASELSSIDFGATSGSVNYVTISVFGTITRE